MRVTAAALLLVIASAVPACVHETTVFHSLNGTNYYRGDAVAPADAPTISPSAGGGPAPSR